MAKSKLNALIVNSSLCKFSYLIWANLDFKWRLRVSGTVVLMLLSGLSEAGSVAAALPFLSLLSDPSGFVQNPYVARVATTLRIESSNDLIIAFTLLFASAIILSSAIRLTNLWVVQWMGARIGSDLSCKAYVRTLYQPYSIHLQRNSSEIISAILQKSQLTVATLNCLMQLVTSFLVSICLIVSLFVIDWRIAFVSSVVFGCAYGLISLSFKGKLSKNSKKVSTAIKQQQLTLSEGFGGIRDILLSGNQHEYETVYRNVDLSMRMYNAQSNFLSQSPRYVLEVLSVNLIAFLGLIFVLQKGDSAEVIPLLGAFAIASQRLMPALQQVYNNWASIKSRFSSVTDFFALVNQPLPSYALNPVSFSLPLNDAISLDNVSFQYSQVTPWILRGINFQIKRGERIGIVGSTGSGKSTLMDLLLGLLEPTEGRIIVDDVDLYEDDSVNRIAAWRSSIAQVPQTVYLSDSSFMQNIAFGTDDEKIDLSRVKAAAIQAQIHNFIESLPEGYNTFVGERGVRLSGGQRQRIGIARALYNRAKILFLDEATSALDESTEEAVMESISGLSRNLTIIMIAHRLSTLKHCDRVVAVSKGGIIAKNI